MLELDAFIANFASFIAAAPSAYHAAYEVARQLGAAGFELLDETAEWPNQPGRWVVVRDGAVIAWVQPTRTSLPFRIVGAHTDSPSFKLKPNPGSSTAGLLQAGVEIYGGPILNSWLDRELELAGRLTTKDGAAHLARTGPMLRIPQLAIHLDREASVTLDRERHMLPVWGAIDSLRPAEAAGVESWLAAGTASTAVSRACGSAKTPDVIDVLAADARVDPTDVVGHDVLVADTAPATRFGRNQSLFAAGRLDNLSSVYAAMIALMNTPSEGEHVSVFAAFDHEELGSESRSGASGPFLEDVLARISAGVPASESERRRAFAASWVISADAGHAVHPNYPEKHDPINRPILGGGPLLKLNANQRYATDAVGSGLWREVCNRAGIPVQTFVSNNTVPCGSTIGPLTATRLGIRTIDVGVPLLSMHSARELAHVSDLHGLARALTEFFSIRPH